MPSRHDADRSPRRCILVETVQDSLARIEVSAGGQCRGVIGVDGGAHGDGPRRDARTSWKTDVSKARYDDHGRPSLSPRAELCRSFPAVCPLQDLHVMRYGDPLNLPHANYKPGSGLWWSPSTTVGLLKALAACVCSREGIRNRICIVQFHDETHSGVGHLPYSFSPDRSDCLQVFFPPALGKMDLNCARRSAPTPTP